MGLNVSVFGLGYVGAVTAACLAEKGHNVIGVDVNPAKVAMLQSGHSPIVEPGLEELVASAVAAGRLRATVDAGMALRESELSFLTVGTPSLRNGGLDLSAIECVCQSIGDALRIKRGSHCVVIRSTVLPGTSETLVVPTLEARSGKRAGVDFVVCSNPEFLREGSAIADFFSPPFTVLGCYEPEQSRPLREIYAWKNNHIVETSIKTAEMLKYACNAFHAVKVCFANEIGTLCGDLGVDADSLMQVFTADTKLNISKAYLSPGFAFGGSCLPKDLRAITYQAKQLDLRLPLLEAVLASNNEHIERAIESILALGRRRIGVIGLSFKPDTDDLRNSAVVQLVKRLVGEGSQLKIWDPDVNLGRLIGSNRQFIEEVIPHIGSLLCERLDAVLQSAEVIVIASSAMTSEAIRSQLRPDQTLVDLRTPVSSSRQLQAAVA